MPFEISGHSFRLLNFLHHFSNTIEYWISFSTLRRVLLRSVRLPDILFFLMISFTLNRIYTLSWMQLSDIPFFEHDDHVLLSNKPFRRDLNIRLPDIPFFSFSEHTFSRLSKVLNPFDRSETYDFRIFFSILLLSNESTPFRHSLAPILKTSWWIFPSKQTDLSLLNLDIFLFDASSKPTYQLRVHIFLLASFKRTFKIHKISLESGWLTKFSVAAVSTTSSLSLSLSLFMEREPYFTRVSIKRTKWK